MSFRSVPVIPESCRLQHLHHVLHIGMQATAANTRSNRPVRVSTDFELVPQKSMGHTPLELSRSAEASLMTAISTQRPLVLRSGIAATDVAALFDDWELRVAQDTTLYQMAGGKGQHTLETMWAAPHREMEGEVVAGGRMAGWEGSLWEAVGVVGLFVTASMHLCTALMTLEVRSRILAGDGRQRVLGPLALALAKTDVWEGHAGQTQATSSRMQNPFGFHYLSVTVLSGIPGYLVERDCYMRAARISGF